MKTRLLALLLTAMNLHAADYSAIVPKLETVIRGEMREWEIGGIAVALVDDQQVVHAAGFGEAKRDSIFRCGSISKLFNALAVMQQMEAGKLDLDALLQTYGPGLLPLNSFPEAPAVTLRQMLCHRSGLQREATVGGYFDPTQPSLAATVASIASGVLATRPGEKTRYSNFAASIAGRVVERVAGQSFEDYQRAHILDQLGMKSSAWTLAKAARERIIVSHMRVADGRGGWTRRDAPLFELGTIPAGNLFSTSEDVARFASALIANDGKLVKPETLAEMWKPQLTPNAAGFGLGFMVGKFREHLARSGKRGDGSGPDFIPLIVSERHGHLYAMTENMVDYRLTPLNRHVCTLPPGMYVNEQIVFLTGPEGRAHAVNFASMILPRRL